MAKRVQEIMNRELFWVGPEERVEDVLGYILALGITGVPVLDAERRPIGMVSFRDLTWVGAATVSDRMHKPALSVRAGSAIEEAARLIAQSGFHRLPVLDEHGSAIGLVSALDVVRGLVGAPAPHPRQFPHYDGERGLVWTDDTPLEPDWIEAAPDGPGVLLLVQGGANVTDHLVWAEPARNVRARLLDMVSLPQTGTPQLARILERSNLRYRAAAIEDPAHARAISQAMGRRARGLLP
jgi:CBS domain-containing protein